MLQNDFFTITRLKGSENKIEGTFVLNTGHAIFNGHFPQQPVMPGVTMLQIVTEILHTHTQQPYGLVAADHLKFLNLIVPKENEPILFDIDIQRKETLLLTVTLSYQGNKAFKGKMSFAAI